jgi:hypothetical protein
MWCGGYNRSIEVEIEMTQKYFVKFSNIKFNETQFIRSRAVS